MRHTKLIGALLLSVLVLVLVGWLAGDRDDVRDEPLPRTLTYRSGVPLKPTAIDAGRQGTLRREEIRYTSVDGQRVPAVLAIPTDRKPQGCLVYQGGFGLAKDQIGGLPAGAAALRLATFTIDPRNVGARGSLDKAIAAAAQPETLLEMVSNTAADVRVGIDYLMSRPECQENIAFMGTSFGAVVGAIVAGEDSRVKATVLTSIGPTFERAVEMTNAAVERDPDFPIVIARGATSDPELLDDAVRVLARIDPARWIGKISPRPVMLINGRDDPLVSVADARALAADAREPKTILDLKSGHDPFGPGPEQQKASAQVATFFADHLGLTFSD